jgi:Domain of unknown function (DUF4260)
MSTITASIGGTTVEDPSTSMPGMVQGAVRSWLRLEGLAAFGAGLVLFGLSGASWLLLVPLLLLPDISAVGYLGGPRLGAVTYNLAHSWAPGFAALALGVWLAWPAMLVLAAVLIAHVGMDRAAGYGLKLSSSFQDTHLGRIGRAKA